MPSFPKFTGTFNIRKILLGIPKKYYFQRKKKIEKYIHIQNINKSHLTI